jgi:hypothetical protein
MSNELEAAKVVCTTGCQRMRPLAEVLLVTVEPLTDMVQDHGHICCDVGSLDSRCKRSVACRRRSRGRLGSVILSQSATLGSDDGKSAQEGKKEALHLVRLGWAFGVKDDCTGGYKWLKPLWSHRSSARTGLSGGGQRRPTQVLLSAPRKFG